MGPDCAPSAPLVRPNGALSVSFAPPAGLRELSALAAVVQRAEGAERRASLDLGRRASVGGGRRLSMLPTAAAATMADGATSGGDGAAAAGAAAAGAVAGSLDAAAALEPEVLRKGLLARRALALEPSLPHLREAIKVSLSELQSQQAALAADVAEVARVAAAEPPSAAHVKPDPFRERMTAFAAEAQQRVDALGAALRAAEGGLVEARRFFGLPSNALKDEEVIAWDCARSAPDAPPDDLPMGL